MPAGSPRRKRLAASLALALLSLPVPASGSQATDPAPAASRNDECTALPGVNDRCPSWTATYDNANGHNGPDRASAVAISNSGDRVFATGESWDNNTGNQTGCCPPPGGMDVATAAFDPATGQQLWAARYNGDDDSRDRPAAMAVSPDDSTVFVTGGANQIWTPELQILSDYLTLAYDTETGERLWASTYSVPDSDLQQSSASDIAVSRDGSRVYVTGYSRTYDPVSGVTSPPTVTTVAYDTATGEELWSSRRPGGGVSIDVSPSGDRVYVTGFVQVPEGGPGQYLTMAYEAADPDHLGEVVWTASYTGGTDNFGALLEVSPNGSQVFVTGQQGTSSGLSAGSAYGTVAYEATSGAQLWAATYAGQAPGSYIPTGLDVSPEGNRIFVTGYNANPATNLSELGTVAYDAATGGQIWAKQDTQAGGTFSIPTGVAASPDGRRVYVTGRSQPSVFVSNLSDIVTLAYLADTGAKVWSARYNSASGQNFDYGAGVAVTPDSSGVLVAGTFERRSFAVAGVPINPSANPGDIALLRYEA